MLLDFETAAEKIWNRPEMFSGLPCLTGFDSCLVNPHPFQLIIVDLKGFCK